MPCVLCGEHKTRDGHTNQINLASRTNGHGQTEVALTNENITYRRCHSLFMPGFTGQILEALAGSMNLLTLANPIVLRQPARLIYC